MPFMTTVAPQSGKTIDQLIRSTISDVQALRNYECRTLPCGHLVARPVNYWLLARNLKPCQ